MSVGKNGPEGAEARMRNCSRCGAGDSLVRAQHGHTHEKKYRHHMLFDALRRDKFVLEKNACEHERIELEHCVSVIQKIRLWNAKERMKDTNVNI